MPCSRWQCITSICIARPILKSLNSWAFAITSRKTPSARVEWPQQGTGVLPEPDLALHLCYQGEGREAKIEAISTYGSQLLDRIHGSQG